MILSSRCASWRIVSLSSSIIWLLRILSMSWRWTGCWHTWTTTVVLAISRYMLSGCFMIICWWCSRIRMWSVIMRHSECSETHTHTHTQNAHTLTQAMKQQLLSNDKCHTSDYNSQAQTDTNKNQRITLSLVVVYIGGSSLWRETARERAH
jgi:hypothetical protein